MTETGLLAGGREFALDTIIWATGFDAMTGSLLRINPRGRGGLTLQQKWQDGPRTYLGLCTAGFPNLFMINGPGSPAVLSNMVQSIEQHVDWIARCLRSMRDRAQSIVEASAASEEEWVAHCNEVVARTLRASEDSWYVGTNIPGRPRVFMAYAGGFPAYTRRCEAVIAAGFSGFAFQSAKASRTS